MTNKDKIVLYNAIYITDQWLENRMKETSSVHIRTAMEEEKRSLQQAKTALERLAEK